MQKRKSALQNLRRYDSAGRIMETGEAVKAARPCTQCARHGARVLCKVYGSRVEKACAFCKKQGRSDCDANAAGASKEVTKPSIIRTPAMQIDIQILKEHSDEQVKVPQVLQRMLVRVDSMIEVRTVESSVRDFS